MRPIRPLDVPGPRRFPVAAIAVLAATFAAHPALAGDGPTPPELKSASPADQEAEVDLFTGEFRYSVPLMEVPGPHGGYPITLSYSSGISPDQEATWVGLGWSLNPGSIVRQMRGIPDDFAGTDKLRTIQDVEPNATFGLGLDANLEVFGLDGMVGLSGGFKGYFNTYRGLGYTRTIGLSGQTSASGTSASVGLDLSLDSQEGLKAAPSLSLADAFRFSAELEEFRGLSALSVSPQVKNLNMNLDLVSFLGYARPTSIPATGREMEGFNINLSFKFGAGVQGVFVNLKPYGFFNLEKIKNTDFETEAYGFLHLHEALEPGHERAALDFNREKDGAIYDHSPNLAMPILTHDLFTVSGRDVTGTFRAYRNDIPVVFDPKQESSLVGGALGVEIGPGTVVHVGVNGSLNRNATVIGSWDGGDEGALLDALKGAFTGDSSGALERTYFKFIGEPSSAGAVAVGGGTSPVAVPLKASWGSDVVPDFYAAEAVLQGSTGQSVPLGAAGAAPRVPRATLVQAFTQKDRRDMRAALYDFPEPLTDSYRKDTHIAGFRVTLSDGLRYVYGIAVYNTVFEEHEFSVRRSDRSASSRCELVDPPSGTPAPGAAFDHRVPGSEKLLQVKVVPPYATSYLLTAILGVDYVDADETPGPSAGDYGYWVRFQYQRDAQPFTWRSPYNGARFVRGPENGVFVATTERRGDKGFVTYGQRESWVLSSIDTATHRALFCTSNSTRVDGLSAASRSQTDTPTSGFVRPRRLDRVALFSRSAMGSCTSEAEGKPLITAKLEYDQTLAPGSPNHVPSAPATARGKLTLKKVYFTHGDNSRGQASPFEFDYEDGDPSNNPPIGEGKNDRWDTYRETANVSACPDIVQSGDPTLGIDSTYTAQGNPDLDRWSSAWALRRIVEPSGRTVKVDFESDDYAYVQDKPAMRMFPIRSVGASATASSSEQPMSPVSVSGGGARPRVYFALESPLSDPADVARLYLDAGKQVYFKVRLALKRPASPTVRPLWQTVSGYANALAAGTASGPNGEALGWIELAPVQGYHPFAMAAWQYLRLQQPELISDNAINGEPVEDPFIEALKVVTMIELIDEIITMASGVYPRWLADGWGQTVDLTSSWIRLREPDGIKKGGGSRVKRLRFSDSWSESTSGAERSLETGSVYSYRLPDGRSSGVAAYEPLGGGDENPLRQAKPFTDEVLLSSAYNLFAETPSGEAHYPSPVVGYSRVVRRSLAAQSDIDARLAGNPKPRPSSAGPVIHEFYTARDFPVRTSETLIEKRRNPQPHILPIPFLGMITLKSLVASQGYSAVLNDMHGKQRRVTTYEYTPEWDASTGDYKVLEDPVEETEYVYRTTGGFGGATADLRNDVDVLIADATRATETLAEQSEFVVDLRSNRTESWDAGINVNTDVIMGGPAPIPIPVPVPNFGYSLSETRTVVTSRVVHRAGLLESIRTRKGSSRFDSRQRAFDPLTGRPLLTETSNPFGDSVFGYETLGRWSYGRMGPAYDDVGRTLSLAGATAQDGRTVRVPSPAIPVCSEDSPTRTAPCVPIGSELVVSSGSTGVRLTVTSAPSDGSIVLATDRDVSSAPSGSATLTRSGDRNFLTTTAGTIRALRDPTVGRQPQPCRWSEEFVCGHCTIREPVTVPTCEIGPALTGFDGGGEKSRSAQCVESGVKWGAAGAGRGGGIEITRAGKVCRLSLRDEKGRSVRLEDVRGHRTVAAELEGGFPAVEPGTGLAYTGLALESSDGALVYVYSSCGGFVGTVNRERTEVEYCDRQQTQTLFVARDVLDAAQTTFRDDWPNGDDDVRFAGTANEIMEARLAFDLRNEFDRGVRGIFRPWKEFVYVDERRQASPVDLRRDGAFDLVTFEGDGSFPEACGVRWRWTREFTRYSPSGFETEERNGLGVPSASLYGGRGSVPIAVASNASQDEIAFEGFEAYAAGSPVAVEQTGEGNVTFYTRREAAASPIWDWSTAIVPFRASGRYLSVLRHDQLVSRAGGDRPDGRDALVDMAARGSGAVEVDSVSLPGIPCPVPVLSASGARGGMTLVLDDNVDFCPAIDPETLAALLEAWRSRPGRYAELEVRIRVPRPGGRKVPVVSVASRAHTGKRSLRVAAESEFAQTELALEPKRRYVVSAWISRDNTDVATYRRPSAEAKKVGLQIRAWAGPTEIAAARPEPFQPAGPIIEGWQRIEGSFEMPAGASRVTLAFLNGTTSPGTAAYFDDVRLLPEDGSLETFVYDSATLRMSAKLDENNFATFYGYAHDGTPRLVRRETVRGVMTEKETRLHVRERQ